MKFNLIHYALLLLAVEIFAFVATSIFHKIAVRFKLLDYPGGRKLQSSPVAYLGGLAIATPITLGSLLVLFSSISSELQQQFYLGLIIPALAIAFVGLLDDLYQLPPWPKFIAQSVAGILTSIVIYISGGGVKLFDNSLLNGVTTTLWVVTIINAINFMDNMDGLATNLSLVISISLFVLSYINGQYLVAALCIAIFGACIGFLFWNKRPALIYLGDAGALYLGFLLAATSIRIDVNSQSELVRVLVPILIFAIPVIDITQVVMTRIIKGKSPFEGGRDHLSHLLLNRGLSVDNVLGILTTSSALLALCGVYLAVGN